MRSRWSQSSRGDATPTWAARNNAASTPSSTRSALLERYRTARTNTSTATEQGLASRVQLARQSQRSRDARTTQARKDREQRVSVAREQKLQERTTQARNDYQQVIKNRRRQAAVDGAANDPNMGTLSGGDDLSGIQSEVRPGLNSDSGGTGGSDSGAGDGSGTGGDGDYDNGYDDGYGDGYHNGWHDGYGSNSIFWGCNSSWGWSSWNWFGGPMFCSSLWWHSWWWGGGHSSWGWWPSHNYWYGPFVPVGYYPQTTTEIIYVEQPVVTVSEVIPIGEAIVPAVAAPAPAQDQAKQEELNRVAQHYLTLGDEAFRAGRYSDAVSHYSRAMEFSPKLGILHLVLSDALMAVGDYRWAAAELRVALELDPSLALHVVDKHAFYGDPTQFDSQIATLERYLSDHFMDQDARLLLAGNYHFGGRPAAAVDLLESSFSAGVISTGPGAVLLEAARQIQHGAEVPQK